jgi:hypothetical protein
MKKPIISFAVLFVFLYAGLHAQTIGLHCFDNIQSAVGNSSINEISFLQNPAQIYRIDSVSLSLGFAPSRFGMSELSPAILMFGKNMWDELIFAASVSGVGSELYNEFLAGVHGSYKLSKMLIFGGSIEYSRLGIKNYGSDNAIQFHLGGLLNLSEILTAGFAFQNISRASYYGGDKSANQRAVFGLGIKAMPDLFFDLDGIITLNRNSGMALAAKYNLEKILSFRLAYLTYPRSIEAGVRIHLLSYLDINGLLYYHDLLGYSQQYGVSLYW